MILTDLEIKQYHMLGNLGIEPFNPDLINPSSLDVRLGDRFAVLTKKESARWINPLKPDSFSTRTFFVDANGWILSPGCFVLAHLMEKVSLPSCISASLRGKSSLARLGLDNSSFGAWIDPGFSGDLVIELANHGPLPILLTPGMKIGQLVFYKHNSVQVPYGEKGRYQNQIGPQGSKGIDKVEEK